MNDSKMYWAMRTSRDSESHREFIKDELFTHGRLRQGWGDLEEQDLKLIHDKWRNNDQLTEHQKDAGRHWRMFNGRPGEYMNIDDVILVPNMPEDGFFTLCRITGDYQYDMHQIGTDQLVFGHIRPVKVLTSNGVANEHELVDASLRRSLRCQSRLWRISPYSDCIERILSTPPEVLNQGSTPEGRTESVVSEAIIKSIDNMTQNLAEGLPSQLQGHEWEKAIAPALEPLFTATVHHTGGPSERGADLEVVIPNPFVEGCDWMIPVQVKDHQDIEGTGAVEQLEQAYNSRNSEERGTTVIAVVLLVTEADADRQLQEKLDDLTDKYHVPFLFCGRDDFMRIIAKGFLRKF